MPVVDADALPEILMRAGVTGRWLSGHEHGAASVSVLRNWVEPGVTIPRHLHDQEEIVLVRNRRCVARLVPEAPSQDALSVFGNLYRTLDDQTAEALSAALASNRKSRRGRVAELRDPWAG